MLKILEYFFMLRNSISVPTTPPASKRLVIFERSSIILRIAAE